MENFNLQIYCSSEPFCPDDRFFLVHGFVLQRLKDLGDNTLLLQEELNTFLLQLSCWSSGRKSVFDRERFIKHTHFVLTLLLKTSLGTVDVFSK